MAGAILNLEATIFCLHSGKASAITSSSRVQVCGSPLITLAAAYTVTGCPFQVPCASGRWVMGALRALSESQFIAIANGVSICIPNGTPLVPQVVQTRVFAT